MYLSCILSTVVKEGRSGMGSTFEILSNELNILLKLWLQNLIFVEILLFYTQISIFRVKNIGFG